MGDVAVSHDPQLHSGMDRKLGAEDRLQFLRDFGIVKRGEAVALLEDVGLDAQAGESLRKLQPERSGADDRDGARQRAKLEDRLVREHQVVKGVEHLWYAGTGSRCYDNRPRGDAASII